MNTNNVNEYFVDVIINLQHGYPNYTEDAVSLFIDEIMKYNEMNSTQREIIDTMINESLDLNFIAYKLNKINDDCKGEE